MAGLKPPSRQGDSAKTEEQVFAVLQGFVPALDLALGLRVVWRTATVLHPFVLQPFSQFTRDVAGSIVAQQARLKTVRNMLYATNSVS